MNRSKASTGATVESSRQANTATSGASKATSWAVNDLSGM
jgi:hypothetical protein